MMAKAHDPASQYVFVEDEDIFADDEHRQVAKKKEVPSSGHYQQPRASTSSRSVSASVIRKPNPVTATIHQDPIVVKRDAVKLYRAVELVPEDDATAVLRRAIKLLSTVLPPPSATSPEPSLRDIWDLQNHTTDDERRHLPGHYQHPRTSTSSRPVPASVIRKPNPVAARFQQDPILVKRDAAKLYRAIKLLLPKPPPPSATNPQLTLHDIFELWNRHNQTSELRNNWQPGLVEEKLGHDVYINRNDYTEELEQLRQMLTERFVSNETASHLTFTYPSTSGHKRDLQRRNGLLKSAPDHLHQNQRKTFFSQFSSSNLRTFTYDNSKRLNLLKSQVDLKTQSQVNTKGQINYRALFHSPKKHPASNQLLIPNNHSVNNVPSYYSMPPSNYSIPSTASTASSSSSCSLVTPTGNIPSGSVSSRSEKLVSSASRSGDPGVKKSCTKNLQFDDVSYTEKHVKKPKKLSQLHGKKMLWAVDTLLKSEGVVSTDPEYKLLYANVYRETTQVWLKYCEKRENGKYKDSATGTSDFMVSVAKQLLPGVEQKLGISCSMIRSRKEPTKRTMEIPSLKTDKFNRTPAALPSRSQSFNESSSIGRKFYESSSSVAEEIVFSPEMLSESNLCEGIDAVISSLDDLPPDPGDKNSSQIKSSALLSVIVTPNSEVKDPPTSSTNSKVEIMHSTPPVEPTMPSLPSSSSNVPQSSLEDIAKSHNLTDHSVSNLVTCHVGDNLPSQHNHLVNPVDLSIPQITSLNKADVIDSSGNDNGIDLTAEIITSLSTLPTISEVFGDDISELPPPMTLEPTSNLSPEYIRNSPLDLKKIPDCIVRLERYVVSENEVVKTPQPPLEPSEDGLNLTPSASVTDGISICKSKMIKDKLNNDESPGEISASSDRRRSKRKRTADISSNENTPTSGSKARLSKKICSGEAIENQTELASSGLRRSSRNKLPFDSDQQGTSITLGDQQIVPLEDIEDLSLQAVELISSLPNGDQISHENDEVAISGVIQEEVTLDNRLNEVGDRVSAPHAGEPSTINTRVESPKNIDKENDSSMENISDADNQNWSPILKLKRSSKDIWSSELKKKRISRRKRENSENSPKSSPFLDLEGPFKYRLCKRARPGEYVSAVIKGGMYSKSYKKLVKNKVITKDCVLVNTVKEGLELKIPLELLKKEHIFFGPNKFQNMISDIVEDALCKLEGLESGSAFNGFTLHDVNQAAMTSSVMERTLKVIESAGEVVRPLFTMYKYALVKQSPPNFQDFYQIFVEILRTSLFLRKTLIENDTIQVRPLNTESPKKIQLEINIPVNLIGRNNSFKDNILKDLTPIHNIISC